VKNKVRWVGTNPKTCQICMTPFKGSFIDGGTKGGSWCLMCKECHQLYGVGLGLGKDQEYDMKTLEKILG